MRAICFSIISDLMDIRGRQCMGTDGIHVAVSNNTASSFEWYVFRLGMNQLEIVNQSKNDTMEDGHCNEVKPMKCESIERKTNVYQLIANERTIRTFYFTTEHIAWPRKYQEDI